MTELTQRFGRTVAGERTRRGLSQEDLAGLTGLHRDTIRRIEGDKNSKGGANLDTIEKLARGLTMYPSELLSLADGSEEPEEDEES
jgi:transcriptional regulator with XRE-family HTH domain